MGWELKGAWALKGMNTVMKLRVSEMLEFVWYICARISNQSVIQSILNEIHHYTTIILFHDYIQYLLLHVYHGGITWSYEELNSLVFNYAMYTTAKSSILHMTSNTQEVNSSYDNVL